MPKTVHLRVVSLMVGVASALGFASNCSVADETHSSFPPLQLFKELCLDAGWALNDVSKLAAERHFALMTSEDILAPDGSPAKESVWQAETAVGPIGLVVVDGTSGSRGHTFTCTVTAPPDSTALIESWCDSSFGDPTRTLSKPPNATETHWAHTFDDGNIDVSLLTRVPNGTSALLTVMKHRDVSKGPARNDATP
jgi:hypothetical protein